ncbi:hypothetical protein ACLB90_19285 [Stenotrophomonas sp. LGBM10]|uniref:hypothetical protein n=1 Tax=Stenotrophomonas sp. LGBM10 TaxID=3390038 RepID=UPI00398AC0BE
MLLNTSVPAVASVPAADPEPVTQTVMASDAPPAAPTAPPHGRALIACLEQLAQQELARLATRPMPLPSALPHPVDPAHASLAWDLGLTGDALDAAR